MGSKKKSMNPYYHLESEQIRIGKKTHFLDNKQSLCDHGGLYPMIAIKGNYISGNVYNQINENL